MTAAVTIVERIALRDEQQATVLNLHRTDAFSDPDSFMNLAIKAQANGAPTYSFEKWFRLRFDGAFNKISGLRFFVPGLVIPAGWTLRFGSATTFANPTNATSAIAVTDVPDADPGENAPNIPGSVLGPGPNWSRWVVLQTSVTRDTGIGPMMGYDPTQHIRPLNYQFRWTEN